jgi:translation initiation factor IF-2
MSVEELQLQKEKVRIYALARELNMESKDLLDLCRQAGFDVKNQLSSLDPEQRDEVVQMLKRGGGAGAAVAVAPAPKTTAPVIPQAQAPIRVLPTRRREADVPVRPAVHPSAPVAPGTVKRVEPPVAPPHVKPAPAPPPVEPPAAAPPSPAARVPEVHTPPGAAAPPSPPLARPADAGSSPAVERPPATPRPGETPPPAATVPGAGAGGIAARGTTPPPGAKVPDLPSAGRAEAAGRSPTRSPRMIRPPVVRAVAPPPLKQRPLREVKKAAEAPVQKPIARLTPEQLGGNRPLRPEDLVNKGASIGDVTVPTVEEDEEDGGKGKGKAKAVPGRDKRREARDARARERKSRGPAVEVQGGHVVVLEDERPARSAARARMRPKHRQPATLPPKNKIALMVPITVRSMSEATGIKSLDLLFKLRDQGFANANINTTVDPDMAQLIALDRGIEVDIKRAPDAEEQLLASLQRVDAPEELQPRAPIVTVMGHVDHGKTSLLDKIRQSNVVDTEAGGITQVIRAWRVEHNGRPITFLDTPGHEAFTKMRARGAQVTDIAVIVVAADDGVMPQTEEAINHAKAAGVSLVVAINKVDMPSANINRTRQQLYGLQVLPDNMGGDTPFVETSAATGKGIDEMLEAISLVAELKELKANPNRPAAGTCLEAMLSEGEGVRATLLIREGTLHRGDVLLCGATYGRVRQMYDDLGRPLQEAGPSVPVRITGLDEVPDADDAFHVVPDLTVAREIADKRKHKRLEAAQAKPRPAVSLETLTAAKIAELKVILKADFRGSIEAIRKELEKLHHEEVRIRILHTGIGGITESDVQLALTSPGDTIIVGFNVVPDDRAKALAEDRGIQIRQYNIIYNLTNDIRSALEGKLKPREEVIHLGRAVVRQVFKISRVGTVAGCYVTQGVIERSAKVRLIRQGVVIFPPPERTAGLESLKRHKDDVREVREGYDCGLKIAGYDDVKVDDVIEAYRVEQIQRTL